MQKLKCSPKNRQVNGDTYERFNRLDGGHSFKQAVPNGFVDYQARTRHGGSVFYFNFELAKEMGLIPKDHAETLTPDLKKKILETFSIVIINEYDLMNEVAIPKKDIRPGKYMATRYLQLQHPSKQGKTSGDGRGIWNGEIKHHGMKWDVSSSGTGATCLSPAHAQTQKFFKTGDNRVGYGNGYNYLTEGLSAALMSEIFHKQGIETERTLAIISFEGGSSINVRAAQNLLRPAHFFRKLKLNDYLGLKSSIDYFIDRQVQNQVWPKFKNIKHKRARYQQMANQMAVTFAQTAAQFEAEYIFCWLDWDGDNILADGGIIDYGSVRQFGLYHYEYRYDDVDRMSTNIPEQRLKARYIVQNFAQIRDFLIEGKKRNIRQFRRDDILKVFDETFDLTLHQILLKKIGFSKKHADYLVKKHPSAVKKLKASHCYFEKTKSARGIYKIEDGVTSNAVFCMRDLHRDLPAHLMKCTEPLGADAFTEVIRSSYAKKSDLTLSPYRRQEILRFQTLYLKLTRKVARKFYKGNEELTLLEMALRAADANRRDRITGDSALDITETLIRHQNSLSFEEKQIMIKRIVQHQIDAKKPNLRDQAPEKVEKLIQRKIKALRDYADGF